MGKIELCVDLLVVITSFTERLQDIFENMRLPRVYLSAPEELLLSLKYVYWLRVSIEKRRTLGQEKNWATVVFRTSAISRMIVFLTEVDCPISFPTNFPDETQNAKTTNSIIVI